MTTADCIMVCLDLTKMTRTYLILIGMHNLLRPPEVDESILYVLTCYKPQLNVHFRYRYVHRCYTYIYVLLQSPSSTPAGGRMHTLFYATSYKPQLNVHFRYVCKRLLNLPVRRSQHVTRYHLVTLTPSKRHWNVHNFTH